MKKHSIRFYFVGMLFSSIITILFFASCAFPYHSEGSQTAHIEDISDDVTFEQISQQGFMGGSVLYNPKRPSVGQLADNASLAIRLGVVEIEDVGNDQAIYSDIAEKAEVGLLHVKKIDENSISFNVELFNINGVPTSTGSYTVKIGNSVDVNDDGFPDVEYKKALRKREGFEDAVYLTFLSSQDTLTTSMFAVLPEQYSRDAYPGGIVGINPDGRFIIRKYEEDNQTRSAVLGVQNGDYVLDTKEGSYQVVVSAQRGAHLRSISDTELQNLEDGDIEVIPDFRLSEFGSLHSPEDLLAALPDSIMASVADTENAIAKLNEVLKNNNLVAAVSQEQSTPIPEDIYDEVIDQIQYYSAAELMDFNRYFLEETFPDLCPRTVLENASITEILPLATFSINPIYEGTQDTTSHSRAADLSQFEKEKAAVLKKFSEFRLLHEHKFADGNKFVDESIFSQADSATISNSYVSFGFKGSFTSTWGSVHSSIGAAALLNLDSKFIASSDGSQDLIHEILADLPIAKMWIGGVLVELNVDAVFTLPYDVQVGEKGSAHEAHMAFIGLYGVGADVGVKYGLEKVQHAKWKRKHTVPYIRATDGSTWTIKDTTYYVGHKNGESEITLKVSPTLNNELSVVVSRLVSAGVNVRTSIDTTLTVDAALKGTASVGLTSGFDVTAAVGLHLPLIGDHISRWAWPIAEVTVTLGEWNL